MLFLYFNLVFSADVLILDDPLSALDMEVGEAIMTDCICGELKGKTRIIVTNAIQHLRHADLIYVLNGGQLIFEGTFEQIQENELFKELKESLPKVN